MSKVSKSPCFLDSNIWLYAMITSAPTEERHEKARYLISSKKEAIVTSTQVINEVCVNLLKKLIFNELQIDNLIKSFYKSYRVIEINREILLTASQLRTRYAFSFWDSLIVASALYADTSILFSEDMQNGLIVFNKLEIINPFK